MQTHLFALGSLRPHASAHFTAKAVRVVLGAMALSVASRLVVPFCGTPVPFTLGPQMALVLGAVLGPAEGVAAVLAWLTAGLGGAPVFASHLVGAAAFAGPAAGYMLGYVPAAYVVGHFGRTASWRGLASWLVATGIILGSGALGIACLLGTQALWPVALAPFWLTDTCKALLAFILVRAFRKRWL